MDAARASLEAGKARIALAQVGKAIEANPQNVEARLLAADIAMRLGNPDRAITELKQISPDSPEAGLANIKLAAAHLSNGNFLTTKQLLANADFDYAQAYWVSANLATAQGERDKAQAYLSEGLSKFPDDAMLVTLDAERLFTSAKPKEASARLVPVLAQTPIIPEAHMLAGQMQLHSRSPLKAKSHFENVLLVEPGQQTAMLALAAIARDAGDDAEASRWIGETSKYGTPQPIGLLFAAQMAYDAGDIERANDLLAGFPPVLAKLPQYQRLTGFIAAARGQRQTAVNALLSYVKTTDGDVIARRLLAENLAAQKDFGTAWDVLSPIMDHPQADGATLLLGYQLAQKTGQGDPERIKQLITRRDAGPSLNKTMVSAGKAIRAGDWAKADGILSPLAAGKGRNDPAVLNNAAAVKAKLGKHEDAIIMAKQALLLAPNSPEIMDTLGWAVWESGNSPDEARALLTKARQAAPNNREIANHWSIAHAQS